MNRLWVVVAGVLLLSGCSASPGAVESAPSAAPSATVEPSAEPAPEPTVAAVECTPVAQSTVDAINVGISGIDPANNISSAVAVRAAERDNVWLVAATINGEGLTDTVGVWATNDDVTVDPQSGSVFSVNGEAAAFSDWGSGDFNVTEGGVEDALGCVG